MKAKLGTLTCGGLVSRFHIGKNVTQLSDGYSPLDTLGGKKPERHKTMKVTNKTKYTINDCLNASSDQTDCGLFIKNFEKLLQKLKKEYPKGQFFIKEEYLNYDEEKSYNIYVEREETKEEKAKRLEKVKKEKQKKIAKAKKEMCESNTKFKQSS